MACVYQTETRTRPAEPVTGDVLAAKETPVVVLKPASRKQITARRFAEAAS